MDVLIPPVSPALKAAPVGRREVVSDADGSSALPFSLMTGAVSLAFLN